MNGQDRVARIEAVLPQTQCRQCGFDGCAPYAQALACGDADIHLCTPGGEIVMQDLAQLLQRPPRALAQAEKAAAPKALAVIDEAECIGCTACIKACPVDAILGAAKQMHTVLGDECTGCGLCLPPCPVDCIRMDAVPDAWLPRSRTLVSGSLNERYGAAQQARQRYEHRAARLARQAQARAADWAARRAAVQKTKAQPTRSDAAPAAAGKPAVDAAALIAKAMQRATENRARSKVPVNQEEFRRREIAKAQERATYRRAIRDFQYGNAEEKAAAQQFLREYREREEAQNGGKAQP